MSLLALLHGLYVSVVMEMAPDLVMVSFGEFGRSLVKFSLTL